MLQDNPQQSGSKSDHRSLHQAVTKGVDRDFGWLHLSIGEIPADRPIFENRGSRISLVYGAGIYHANHKIPIRDIQGTQTRDIVGESLNWTGSRARVDLFRRDPKTANDGDLPFTQ